MFENRKTEVQGVHYTRYIMSWLNAGGRVTDFGDEYFEKWLRANEVTDDEIQAIKQMSCCAGKMELELTARAYIKEQNEYYKKLEEELKEEEKKAEESKLSNKVKKVASVFGKVTKENFEHNVKRYSEAWKEAKL